MNWREQIEAQIEELRDYKCISLQCCNKQNAAADAMQALLDVAVAAEQHFACGPENMRANRKLACALDKLREVGDE